MSPRRTHYEMAFERYLDQRATPYVAVEDVRHVSSGRLGTKAFDYIVYPPGERAYLVEVKGRKSRLGRDATECRHKSWVSRADVDGLREWQRLFGPQFGTAFVFVYWLAGWPRDAYPDGLTFVGRRYAFFVVDVPAYAAHQKPLSSRWQTVSVPVGVFRSISRPLDEAWPVADDALGMQTAAARCDG